MSRIRLHEQDGLLPEQVNPELWPDVDECALSEEDRRIYNNRKKAILMYFRCEGSQADIKEATSIDKSTGGFYFIKALGPD